MKSGFYVAVSAIALLSSGAAYAQNNTASITQSANSSQANATITQSDQITTSSANIVQDAAGSGSNRASATVTQGSGQSNSATNTAKVEQRSVTDGADILINQSGTNGGTNFANVLQNGLVGGGSGGADIAQIANGSGDNRIGTFSFQSFQYDVGFEQQGTNTTAFIRQTTTGALNDISEMVQSGVGTAAKIFQGNTLNSGGTNRISRISASGNLSIYQDSANSGVNELVKFTGGGTKSDFTQSASDSGINRIGSLFSSGVDVTNNSFAITQIATGSGNNNVGTISGATAIGGDATINQTTSGAAFYYLDMNMSGGSLAINQLAASIGTGLVVITTFTGGSGLITQTAASNGGLNTIEVGSNDSSSNLAILQGGSDNGISVDRKFSSGQNNMLDNGSLKYGDSSNLSLSRLTIEQDGTSNKAYLTQYTANNVGRIYQAGAANEATINQKQLSGNTAFIVQLGSSSSAIINQ
jgi:hypothetical protein